MGKISQSEYDALFTEDDSGSLRDQLSRQDNYKKIQAYMEDRFSMTEQDYEKDEIIDSFVNNMRKFNFGQSVVTVTELSYLNKGDGPSLAKRRKIAGDAYNVFDSLDGAFSKDRTLGEKADAVGDYARALIVDPVNILSLGVGKFFASGATKAATQIAKKAAIEAAEAASKPLGVKAVSKKSQEEIARQARKAYTEKILEDASYKTAVNKALQKEVIYSAGFDAAAGVGLEAMNQKARMKADTLKEYDPLAMFLSAAGGLTGGGLAFALNKTRGVSKLPLYSQLVDRSEQIVLTTRQAEMDEAARVFDAAKAVEAVDVKVVQDGTTKLSSFAEQWAERTAEGLNLKIANKEMDEDIYDAAYDYNLIRYFYQGDGSEVGGLKDILYQAGVKQWTPRGKDDRFNLYLGDIYEKLDKSTKDSIQESYDSIFKNAVDSEFKNLSVEDFLKRMSEEAKGAGRTLSLSRQLNAGLDASAKAGLKGKTLPEFTSEQAVDIILDPSKKGVWENTKEFTSNFQKNFIKYLVMHPGTTALNIKGWVQASTMQSFSDMIQATLYGGGAFISDVVGGKTTANVYRNKSKQLVKLQFQKFKNIVDPYSTYEAAMDYLTFRPEARKELFRYIYGGVEVNDVLKELELNPGEKLSRTGFETLTNSLQTLYGVKVQDFLSKTQEFMYALDKQVRLEYDMSLNDFMAQDNVWEYLSDAKSDSYKKFLKIETTAVTDALDNSFSRSFTDPARARKGDPVAIFAGAVESMRLIPIVGAVAPFGQFFNNTLAFTARHTGTTMLYRAAIGKEQDVFEGISRAAAGYMALGAITYREMDNLEKNLAWHEERQSDGQIVSRQYDFPYSHFKIAARIGAHMIRDGKIPNDLKTVFFEQVGLEGFIRNLGDQGRILSNLVGNMVELDGTEAVKGFGELLGSAFSMYSSGFTRFADPFNQAVGLYKGEDYVYADKKQGSKAWNDSLRYVDQIFGKLAGVSQEEKKFATQEDSPSAPIGRVVGFRAVEAPSTIEKLFNDIGKSNWKTDIYSEPEAVNIINDYIFPYLELYADAAVANRWDELPLEQKEESISIILREAKKDVKEILKYSDKDEPRKAGVIFDITNSGVKKEKLREYYETFGTSEGNLWELDTPQLELILSFIKDESFRKKLFEKSRGLD